MLHPHARVRAEPWQNLGRAVNRPIIDDDDFVCGIDLFKVTPDRSACIRCAIKYWIMTETVGPAVLQMPSSSFQLVRYSERLSRGLYKISRALNARQNSTPVRVLAAGKGPEEGRSWYQIGSF
jgi:hypothetical protein